MEDEDQLYLVEVFRGTPWQAGMVKTLLEDEDIEACLADEIIGRNPLFHPSSAVKVMVLETSLEKARAIISSYEDKL